MSRLSDYINKFVRSQKQREIIPNLRADMALRLAQLGIDKSFIFLLSENKKKFISARETAVVFRPRYQKMLLNKNELDTKNTVLAMKAVHPNIINMPFKFFLHPIGIGHFSDLYDKLDRSVSVQNIIDYLNFKEKTPQALQVRRFEEQATASLIFHSEIASTYENPSLEHDVNPAAINTDDALEQILNRAIADAELGQQATHLFDSNDNLKFALQRVSHKTQIRVKRWQADTFEKIYLIAADLPRRLKFADRRIDLVSDEYPKAILMLSIFTLADLTNSSFIARKYSILHETGLRHVGDLVLFHPTFRKILFGRR